MNKKELVKKLEDISLDLYDLQDERLQSLLHYIDKIKRDVDIITVEIEESGIEPDEPEKEEI